MPRTQQVTLLMDEIADFLATCPTREQLLRYHPSAAVQARAGELLQKVKEGRVSAHEQQELDQFQHAEMLMRLVKARLHGTRTPTDR